jgi:hypothetical protein
MDDDKPTQWQKIQNDNTLYAVIEKSINYVKNKKPVWPVLQAFGEDITERMGEKGHFCTPTPEQERCMNNMALTSEKLLGD